ncbi:MAG: hypothetical protein ACXVRH_14585 [Thermoleophilaceae bacterium]
MRAKIETACLWLVAVLSSAYLALHFTYIGDYLVDGGPTIRALLHGNLHFQQPAMGPLSILLRLPFAWLARGHGQLAEYRAGVFPCVLVAGAVGVHLARRVLAAGRSRWLAFGVVAFSVLNPANFHAVANGHPEEILGAALCVAAVVAALEKRSALVVGVLLALALATKQWAVLAIGPTLIAASGARLRTAIVAVVVAAALTLPMALANLGAFSTANRTSADATIALTPASIWVPIEHKYSVRIFDGVAWRTIEKRSLSHTLAGRAKPLIVLLGILLPLGYAALRRRRPAEEALLLLALLFALRAALDPLTTAYYVAPLLFALMAYECVYTRGPPLLTAIGGAVIWYLTIKVVWVIEPRTVTAIFLAWMLPLLAWLGVRVYAPSVISGLGKWLSTSLPSSVTMTRSSIRTPNSPGR